MSEDIVEMARAAQRDDRLADGALYGKLADEIERLRNLPHYVPMNEKCDEYRLLATELNDLVDIWKRARWLSKWSVANVIVVKVWYRMPLIYSALIHHTEGMKAQQRS